VAVDATHLSWARKAEAAIRSLRDVEGVSVQAEGEDVREIHILTSSARPAKQIVRDVQTLLLTRFNRPIDHRVVSVAYARASESAPVAPVPAEEPLPGPGAEAAVDRERIRFSSANVYVSGSRAQAQVELRWKGVSRVGSASGSATRHEANTLIAAATVAAVEEFLEDDWALSVRGVDFVRVGKSEVAVVALALLAHRQEKTLAGCCSVEEDAQQAVALATLAALNRVVGGLQTREPVEYVLRPTSTQEA
jgi:hypothetical protein